MKLRGLLIGFWGLVTAAMLSVMFGVVYLSLRPARSSRPPKPVLWALAQSNQPFELQASFHTVYLAAPDGQLFGWGNAGVHLWRMGRASLDPKQQTNTPQRLASDLRWKRAIPGWDLSVGLQADGTLHTWGSVDGQVLLEPRKILGLTNIVALEGGDHFLALTRLGQLFAWGQNSFGEAGPDGLGKKTPLPRPLNPAMRWRAIAANRQPASAAIRDDGSLWWWGQPNGELNPPLAAVSSPTRVGSEVGWERIFALAEGGFVAQKADRSLWHFGWAENHADSPTKLARLTSGGNGGDGLKWTPLGFGWEAQTELERSPATGPLPTPLRIWFWGKGGGAPNTAIHVVRAASVSKKVLPVAPPRSDWVDVWVVEDAGYGVCADGGLRTWGRRVGEWQLPVGWEAGMAKLSGEAGARGRGESYLHERQNVDPKPTVLAKFQVARPTGAGVGVGPTRDAP